MMRRLVCTCVLALGCDPKEDAGPQVCDPFAADQQPSKLRELLAVGRAADGGLYVIDHTWFDGDRAIDPRVFVSEGAALRRVRYDGYLGLFEMQWTFPVAHHEPPFTLVVTDDAGVRRMGVLTGAVQEEPFAIGEVGEELTLVEEAEIDGREVFNFVATVTFEYAARADDDRTVVVLGVDDVEDYDHYRLFMGTDALVEHEVTSFARQEDGGTTMIEFTREGETATAWFPTPLSPELSPTLTTGGETIELAKIEPTTLDDATYRCL
jgi:hypothetical protein